MSLCDLPDEILIMIVGRIQLEERLKTRSVCRKIRHVIESQLKTVKSLQVSGRSLKSMLDFVKDSKAKDIPADASMSCQPFVHQDSINKIIRFDRICLLIHRYLTGLTCLRFHRLTITFDGLEQLLISESWLNHMTHFVIRSCYMDDSNFDHFMQQHDPEWWTRVQARSLKHMYYFPITNNQSLVPVIRLLVDGFSCESLPSGTPGAGWLTYARKS